MGLGGAAMELFTKLFSNLLVFVYHCFDRIVIHGYLSGLSRPEQVVFFFRQVVGAPVVSKELLSQRTTDYQNWVEAFARNHAIPIQWAEKGVRKEDFVQPWLRRMVKKGTYGVYFIFKSMEQGPSFRVTVPKFPTKDPNHRILAQQKSRFTHNYFYIRDEVLGPMILRVATFFPFRTTYYLKRPQLHRTLPIRLSPTATSGSVRPCSWTFTSVAIFGSHNRSQSSSDFFPTTRPAPPTWRRLAGATGLFAPIVRRRESRSASQIVLASCAAASAAVTPD
jgi:hypothetical protein